MSVSMLRELELISKEVNATINSMFPRGQEPNLIYVASKHILNAGGKRFRPFLTLKACELVGGRREDALQVATSIELIHNFTIIHDDIMDEDYIRRGVPTIHTLWNVPTAIITGDLLFAKAYEATLRTRNIPPKQLLKIINIITDASIRVCEGQASDILLEKMRAVSEKEYLDMAYKKTAALIEAAAKAGALIGGGTSLQVKKLGDLGRYIGLAFQIIDDILGLIADEEVFGKPIGSDIRDGKNTLLVIHALRHAEENQRKRILSVLGKKAAKTDNIKAVIKTIQSIGSIKYADNKAKTFIAKAKAQLSSFPSSPTKDVLLTLCDYVVSRTF